MQKIKLTMAQALVKYLAAQYVDIAGKEERLVAGVFAIFGHGNVAGMGEALYSYKKSLTTFRAHNEQGMAHAAIAYTKANNRQRIMACTSSIGPGATNMVTAAALAHVNRLPVLLLPGDVFASRAPDPVLQQLECKYDATMNVNDCFRPVSKYFDRITRPEQIINSLPIAIQTLTSADSCGPVTISLPQDVQTEAFLYPQSFFVKRVHHVSRLAPDNKQLEAAVLALSVAQKPLIIAGGGVHYSQATGALKDFIEKHAIPVVETQSGKGAIAWNHPNYAGAIGVTGSTCANKLAQQADVILAIGTRLQDFTTASRTIFDDNITLIQLNIEKFDAIKHGAQALVGDAKIGLEQLDKKLENYQAPDSWLLKSRQYTREWNDYYAQVTSIDNAPKTETGLPSDAQVLGAIKRTGKASDIIVCAAGGLPGELHKLWRTDEVGGYHVEYGYSCMGYEIAGGLGVKMAQPKREVIVVVGDGSYMMLNSELSTSVMLGHKIIVVVLDNRGFACINRLQNSLGADSFNNLLKDCAGVDEKLPKIDFCKHAQSLGAIAEQVATITALESALNRARKANKSYVICLDTDPFMSSTAGGSWWDVAIAEVSDNENIKKARENYQTAKLKQPY